MVHAFADHFLILAALLHGWMVNRKPDLTGKTLKQEGNNLCLLLEQTQVLTCFLDILIKS